MVLSTKVSQWQMEMFYFFDFVSPLHSRGLSHISRFLKNVPSHSLSPWLLLLMLMLLLACFLKYLCISVSTVDLWPSIEAQKETLLQSIKMESFAESHPVLLRCTYQHAKDGEKKKNNTMHHQTAISAVKLWRQQLWQWFSTLQRKLQKGGYGGYDHVNEVKMPNKIQQVL